MRTKKLILAALFLALGLVLPFLTGQIPQIGQMLSPMHIPVLLCGFILGWRYGLVLGLILPLLRSFLFGFPPLYPNAVAMSFELAAYGFLSGWLYSHSKWHCLKALYKCLILSMIGGRIVWGFVSLILYQAAGNAFTVQMFLVGAFLGSIPGILIQLTLIPALMIALNKIGILPKKEVLKTLER